jgi:hypothetical protein
MSARRIKRKVTNGIGPLDWIRTDDASMFEFMYIACMTRGVYHVLEALREALLNEAKACKTIKAPINAAYEGDEGFCREAASGISDLLTQLQEKWDQLEDAPVWSRRNETKIGGIYPLPGNGIYIPKPGSY